MLNPLIMFGAIQIQKVLECNAINKQASTAKTPSVSKMN